MLRRFTKDIGRYKEGEVHDYPKSVWDRLAVNGKTRLERFTEVVEFNPGLQNMLRGPVRVRTRLGTA